MRLLLVDDHPMIFDALKIILERLPGHISAEFLPDFGDAVTRLAADPPIDLLLLDLTLPGFSGTAALVDIRRRFPELPVGVISAIEGGDVIAECIDLGARGYLTKSLKSSAMLSAIQLMARGGTFVPGDEANGITTTDPAAAIAQHYGLTPRQIDVLKIMVSAKSNREIADTLGVSVNTVAVHVAAILAALGVKNRTEAVMVAARFGLRG
ncbi:MAG: response regulator transcription factor [Burkholderiaceae bacterium]